MDVLLRGGRLFPAFACHFVTCHFDDWENSFMLSVSPLTVTHGRFQTRLSPIVHAKQASNVAANSFETRMDGLYAPSTPSHVHSIHVGLHATEHPTECLRVAQQAGANVYGKPHPGNAPLNVLQSLQPCAARRFPCGGE